jgi:hypothetical protein
MQIGTGTLRPSGGIATYFAYLDLHLVLEQAPTSPTIAVGKSQFDRCLISWLVLCDS